MPARVVSLVPSVTETLLAWQVTPVAVTRFCEQPGLPQVGGTKDPDVAAIVALVPDLVVMNDEENRIEDADALRAAGLAVEAVNVRSVVDVGPAFARLAARLDIDRPPIDTQPGPATEGDPLPVFVPVWRRPWMTLNHETYGSSLLEGCGAVNVFAGAPDRYPEVDDLDAVIRRDPALVLAPSEPYPFRERHRPELERVAPVEFVDGRDLFWWGVRTPPAAARLARVIAAAAGRRRRRA